MLPVAFLAAATANGPAAKMTFTLSLTRSPGASGKLWSVLGKAVFDRPMQIVLSSYAQKHRVELAEAPHVTFPFATRLGGRLELVHRVTARDHCAMPMVDPASQPRVDYGRG
jgi:hypothetical protein